MVRAAAREMSAPARVASVRSLRHQRSACQPGDPEFQRSWPLLPLHQHVAPRPDRTRPHSRDCSSSNGVRERRCIPTSLSVSRQALSLGYLPVEVH